MLADEPSQILKIVHFQEDKRKDDQHIRLDEDRLVQHCAHEDHQVELALAVQEVSHKVPQLKVLGTVETDLDRDATLLRGKIEPLNDVNQVGVHHRCEGLVEPVVVIPADALGVLAPGGAHKGLLSIDIQVNHSLGHVQLLRIFNSDIIDHLDSTLLIRCKEEGL
jgi:hypothetical protein